MCSAVGSMWDVRGAEGVGWNSIHEGTKKKWDVCRGHRGYKVQVCVSHFCCRAPGLSTILHTALWKLREVARHGGRTENASPHSLFSWLRQSAWR